MTDARRALRRKPRVGCEEATEAISARIDGEELPVAGPDLDAHLAGCPACRDFEAQLAGLGRRLRLRSARPVPQDLVAILAPSLEASPRPSRRPVWRLDWPSTTRWAGATMSAVLAAVALSVGVGSHPHMVPTRPPSACTVGLRVHRQPSGG